jgi:hypothetical protein
MVERACTDGPVVSCQSAYGPQGEVCLIRLRPQGGLFKFADGFLDPDIAGTPTTAGLGPSAKVRFRERAWEGRQAFAFKIEFKNLAQSANSGPAAYWRVGLPKDRGRSS